MSGGHSSPGEDLSIKRKSQEPYFVDKRLTPRVKEYLNSYEYNNETDAEEIVDYLQMTFREYGRKKRNALRQSVIKVLNSLPASGKKRKFQEDCQERYYMRKNSSRASNVDMSSTKSFEVQNEFQPVDEDEGPLIAGKDKNLINNSMHLMYKKANKNKSLETENKYDSDFIGNTTSSGRFLTYSQRTEAEVALDKAYKEEEIGTTLHSSTGNKGHRTDTDRLQSRLSRKSRKLQSSRSQGISENKGIKSSESSLKLSDIGGYETAIEEVMKLLFHLKHPEVFQRLGVKPPRGFLLHGPPGCGKTLLANIIAGELQLPYYKLAATEIVSGVSGESEEKLRDIFTVAKASSPSIIFLDEIDAVAPNREGTSKEMERRIVSQLLICIDDLDQTDTDVLLIGATNRLDSLDPALRRAGRFDREICLGIPDKAARQKILEVVCGGLRLSPGFDVETIAALTPGFVGADLVSLTREAAMFAVKRIFENLGQSKGVNFQETDEEIKDGKNVTKLEGDSLNTGRDFSITSWLIDKRTLTLDQLEDFFIQPQDFKQALVAVQPSSKREGFVTVPDVTWDDIGALENIRDELSLAILAPVRHSEVFASLGIENPPGILLAGPPGCGKTLLAKAIANEAGINFISVKGPELLNMYVGESERAVRQVFQRARNSAPCVIFFDEIDALCPKRSDVAESSASSRVVNQLLTEMDGLVARKHVFLMGATNRPDIIDPAIIRPGRLDKILFVGLPKDEDRVKILQTVTKFGTRPKLADDIILEDLAYDPRCERFSGADLAALVREASVQALKEFIRKEVYPDNSRPIQLKREHFEEAFNKLRPSVSLENKRWYDELELKFGTQT